MPKFLSATLNFSSGRRRRLGPVEDRTAPDQGIRRGPLKALLLGQGGAPRLDGFEVIHHLEQPAHHLFPEMLIAETVLVAQVIEGVAGADLIGLLAQQLQAAAHLHPMVAARGALPKRWPWDRRESAAEAGPSPYAKLQQANAELQIELHDVKRRAADGDLFDLKNDCVKSIAGTIIEKVGIDKAVKIAHAILDNPEHDEQNGPSASRN